MAWWSKKPWEPPAGFVRVGFDDGPNSTAWFGPFAYVDPETITVLFPGRRYHAIGVREGEEPDRLRRMTIFIPLTFVSRDPVLAEAKRKADEADLGSYQRQQP